MAEEDSGNSHGSPVAGGDDGVELVSGATAGATDSGGGDATAGAQPQASPPRLTDTPTRAGSGARADAGGAGQPGSGGDTDDDDDAKEVAGALTVATGSLRKISSVDRDDSPAFANDGLGPLRGGSDRSLGIDAAVASTGSVASEDLPETPRWMTITSAAQVPMTAIAAYCALFKDFDRDHSGHISRFEMQQAFKKYGVTINKAQLKTIMNEIDTDDGDGEVSVPEFVVIMHRIQVCQEDEALKDAEDSAKQTRRHSIVSLSRTPKPGQQARPSVTASLPPPETPKERAARIRTIDDVPLEARAGYRAIFETLDEDESGAISVQEMRMAFANLDIDISPKEMDELIAQIDEDGSGEVDVLEFSVALHRITVETEDDAKEDAKVNYGEDLFDVKVQVPTISRIRAILWDMFDDPSSSLSARIISIVVMGLIATSIVMFVVETLPQFHRHPQHMPTFRSIELVCVVGFTIEYVMRFITCPNKLQFFLGILNAVDLLAVLPFYVEEALNSTESSGSALLRSIRLIRVFRVAKISRYLSWLKVFGDSLSASIAPLSMVLFVLLLVTVFNSSAIFFAERGKFDKRADLWRNADVSSPFSSIPDAFYWCMTTLTTVGYGDVIPLTVLGKLVAALTALSGVLILAIPISIIATNFLAAYSKLERQKQIRREQKTKIADAEQNLIKRRSGVNSDGKVDWKTALQSMAKAQADIVASRGSLVDDSLKLSSDDDDAGSGSDSHGESRKRLLFPRGGTPPLAAISAGKEKAFAMSKRFIGAARERSDSRAKRQNVPIEKLLKAHDDVFMDMAAGLVVDNSKRLRRWWQSASRAQMTEFQKDATFIEGLFIAGLVVEHRGGEHGMAMVERQSTLLRRGSELLRFLVPQSTRSEIASPSPVATGGAASANRRKPRRIVSHTSSRSPG